VDRATAHVALTLASHKLPVKTRIVERGAHL
jgi:ribosomal protein L16/L10AE